MTIGDVQVRETVVLARVGGSQFVQFVQWPERRVGGCARATIVRAQTAFNTL